MANWNAAQEMQQERAAIRAEQQLDEIARRRGVDPRRARAIREALHREQLTHARTDGPTLYCGLPADADVRLDYDVFVDCPGCAAEVRRRDSMNADAADVIGGLIQQREELEEES